MIPAVTGVTRVAVVIGDPIVHSRSPAIWNAAFAAASLDWVLVACPVPAGLTATALDGARALRLAAVAVTMPHKTTAAAACDELSDTARALGAVNAIRNDAGRLVGDSTDGEGFVRSLGDDGVDPSGCCCVVLGAGGAARAIVHALGRSGAEVVVAARRPVSAEAAAALAPGGRGISLDDVGPALPDVDVVVNATPLGMRGEPAPVDIGALRSDAVVVDTVYHPAETPLLATARARGLTCIGGLGMLVHQAAAAFRMVTGADPPLEVMRAAANAP